MEAREKTHPPRDTTRSEAAAAALAWRDDPLVLVSPARDLTPIEKSATTAEPPTRPGDGERGDGMLCIFCSGSRLPPRQTTSGRRRDATDVLSPWWSRRRPLRDLFCRSAACLHFGARPRLFLHNGGSEWITICFLHGIQFFFSVDFCLCLLQTSRTRATGQMIECNLPTIDQ